MSEHVDAVTVNGASRLGSHILMTGDTSFSELGTSLLCLRAALPCVRALESLVMGPPCCIAGLAVGDTALPCWRCARNPVASYLT